MAYEIIALNAMSATLANLQTHLTAIESRFSLGSGFLTPPVEIMEAFVPADNRSPLVQYYISGEVVEPDGKNRHASVPIDLVITYNGTTGSAGLSAGERFVSYYLAAFRRMIMSNRQLGNTSQISEVNIEEASRTFPGVDDSATRHTRVLALDVLVHDAGGAP